MSKLGGRLPPWDLDSGDVDFVVNVSNSEVEVACKTWLAKQILGRRKSLYLST